MSTVLLTGATGFLGMEVLVRLLADGHDVVALVRAGDQEEADARIDGVLARLYDDPPERPRLRAIAGDVTRPLPEVDADTVVHCAASISFDLPIQQALEVNTAGTANVLAAAERMPSLRHVVHVSTAYVSGTHEGLFRETDLDLGQGFRNTYEETKNLAERLVGESGLPVTVVRPSIVVGDRRTGWTPAFNVLYWPIQAFARGLIDHVPARPEGVVDVVPVDYVADSIAWLVGHGRPEGTLSLVAGEHASRTDRMLELVCDRFDLAKPRIVAAHEHTLPEQAEVYLPYFDVSTRFDDSRARALLGPAGLRVTPLEDYFGTLMDYATSSRWGRSPSTRGALMAA
jgi:long-chain acyl-CoA synthetase